MPAPPPIAPPPRADACLYAADVARVGEVLGLEPSEIAARLGASVRSFESWLRSGAVVPASWAAGAWELALEAKRARHFYLSADVRRLRSVAGLTQYEMAVALGVGRHTITQWEAGKRLPAGKRLAALHELERQLLDNPPNPLVRECPKCGRTYPRTDRYFHGNPTSPDGLHSQCRGCRSGSGESYWIRKFGSIF